MGEDALSRDVVGTPTTTSPYNYFQERYRSEPWRVLVVCVLLNQTPGRALEGVHTVFFDRWPTAGVASHADVDEMAAVLRPLGLQNRRARTIVAMSTMYAAGGWTRPEELPGVGRYGADSWRIFVEGVLVDDVSDKELRRYVEWARSTPC